MVSVRKTLKTLWKVLAICSSSWLISCISRPAPSETEPRSFEITGFVSTDLSEDAQAISTKEDEIVVAFGILTLDESEKIIAVTVNTHIEHKVLKDTLYPVHFSYNQPSTSQEEIIFIGLLEYDEQINLKEFQHQLSSSLNKVTTISEIRSTWNKVVKTNNPFNDELGITIQRPENIQSKEIISGVHLHDSYRYLFHVSFKSPQE